MMERSRIRSRLRTMFTVAIPSIVVGGLLFSDHVGLAAAGSDELVGFWPAASDSGSTTVAQQHRGPLPPPPPPPPTPRHSVGGGVSLTIKGNKVQITGIDDFVAGHLEAVQHMLRNNSNLPKDVRDKIQARMDRAKIVVDHRLKNLKISDLDQLGEEMERMGEELERSMAGLDEDLAKHFAKDFGKDFARDLARKLPRDVWAGNDDADDADDDAADAADAADDVANAMGPDVDVEVDSDDSDLRDAIGEIKDMALKPSQRDAIVKLRTDSDAHVAVAKQQLEDASQRLETALADPRTSDADIARYVDQISGHEAAIRKARLLAWVNARRVLDVDQVQKIEHAAKTAGKNQPK